MSEEKFNSLDELANFLDGKINQLQALITPSKKPMRTYVIETDEAWFLAIGNESPWDCEQFEVPEELAVRINKFLSYEPLPLVPDEVTNRKEYIQYILDIHGISKEEID